MKFMIFNFIAATTRCLSEIFSYLIPVKNDLLVFHSFPNYGDNSYAVFKYLIKCYPGRYKYVWLIDEVSQKDDIYLDLANSKVKENVKICMRYSIKGLYYCYKCRYIFNTVGIFTFLDFRTKDKRINMWHGMPLKHITSNTRNGDYTIATSEMYIPIMSDGLKIPIENVLLTGQPRNDMLFHPELLHKKYQKLLLGFDTIGIWMPTFRRSHIDLSYNDGHFDDDYISFLKISDLDLLNDKLIQLNTLLIIKLHPLDIMQTKTIHNRSNILIFKSSNFEQRYMYPLLANCDFLLSDFSSVVIDYDILNRPIGMTLDNIDSYKKTRGLYTTDFPGKSIFNYNELESFIEGVKNGTISHIDTKDRFNKYKDDNSTKRLLEHFDICG